MVASCMACLGSAGCHPPRAAMGIDTTLLLGEWREVKRGGREREWRMELNRKFINGAFRTQVLIL